MFSKSGLSSKNKQAPKTTTATKPANQQAKATNSKPLTVVGTGSPQTQSGSQNKDEQIKPPAKQIQKAAGKRTQAEEEKSKPQEEVKQGPYTQKPSAKYTSIKTVDPFSNQQKQKQNSFSFVYNSGGIPCRINHGSANMYLQWDKDVDLLELSFDPLLVILFEGLTEDKHPYNFLVGAAIKDMLTTENAGEKVVPLLSKLIWPLRTGLQNTNEKVFENSLTVAKLLSDVVGPNLNQHLKNLLVPIVKKVNDKKYRDKIFLLLKTFEDNGGSDVGKTIKSSIPTYTNM